MMHCPYNLVDAISAFCCLIDCVIEFSTNIHKKVIRKVSLAEIFARTCTGLDVACRLAFTTINSGTVLK